MERKNKSICVSGNTYRKSIDVVPAFSITNNLLDGIQFLTDKGEKIITNGQDIAKVIKENYGFAGREYIKYVQSIGFDTIFSRFKGIYGVLNRLFV